MANNLNDWLRSRSSLGFEHLEFGSGMLASLEGSAATLRGTDTLEQVRHAINTGTDQIDYDTQMQAYRQLTGEASEDEAKAINGVGDALSSAIGGAYGGAYGGALSSVYNALPNFGFTDAVKMMVYGSLGVSIVVIGLIALVMSTDAGKTAVKDVAKAAAA